MIRIILCLAALICFGAVRAQILYAVSNEKKIYRINGDYTSTYISTAGPTEYLINDLAITPSGEWYGIAYNSIYQIDPATGATTYITDMPFNFYSGMVCSNDYKLYMINHMEEALYRYDILTGEITNVAYLGFDTPGDLTFYKGNIIFQTSNLDGSVYMIKAYNPETGDLTDIMCQDFYFQLWGLTNMYTDCDNGTIVAVNPFPEMMTLDFEANTVDIMPLQYPDLENIFGLATTNEHLGSLCSAEDLGNLDCELSVKENLSGQITFYPNPATEKLFFSNHEKIKQVTIYDITGKPIKAIYQAVAEIDIADLAVGIYLIKIEGDKNSEIRKLVRQ